MKYDCNKTKNYLHEINRMCKTINDCKACPAFDGGLNCSFHNYNPSAKVVEIVQEWSDKNPEPLTLARIAEILEGLRTGILTDDNNCLINNYGMMFCSDPEVYEGIKCAEEIIKNLIENDS